MKTTTIIFLLVSALALTNIMQTLQLNKLSDKIERLEISKIEGWGNE